MLLAPLSKQASKEQPEYPSRHTSANAFTPKRGTTKQSRANESYNTDAGILQGTVDVFDE